MEYKLFAVRVFVTDWARAIRFYADTLGTEFAYRSDEMGWAQMAPGAGQLAPERGVQFIEPPEKQPWGGVLAHLRDPDGNILTLLGQPR